MKSGQGVGAWMRGLVLGLVTCLLISPGVGAEAVLYFADIFYPDWSDGSIYAVGTSGTGLETILEVGGGLRGLAVDPSAAKLYWSDVENDLIRRADLDGLNAQDLIATGLDWPSGIALHPGADILAWGDATLAQLGTAHRDGSGAAPLLPTPYAGGLAIDTDHDKLYWTTALTASSGEILRANLDGSNVEVVVSGVDKPGRIALDLSGGKIYWTDYVIDIVRRANLDGSAVEDLYVVGANLNPDGIALDLAAGKVYWGQAYITNRQKIMRMNLDGSQPEDFLIGSFGIITDMAMISSCASISAAPPRSAALGCFPNPFTERTAICLSLPVPQPVSLAIYTIDGRRVKTLSREILPAGRHTFSWGGSNERGVAQPSGAYTCLITTADQSWLRTLHLLR